MADKLDGLPFTEKEWEDMSADARLDVIKRMGEYACQRDSTWAGVPLFSEFAKIVMHPRYPYQDLSELGGECDIHGEHQSYLTLVAIVRALDRMKINRTGDSIEDDIDYVDQFYSHRIHSQVLILHNKKTGKRFCATVPVNNNTRLEMLVSYLGISDSWEQSAEETAQKLLKTHLSDRQWSQFVLTGTFLERSERSNIVYMFRRGRPTIAQSGNYVVGSSGQAVFLAALCSHGIGYFNHSFGGAMTPTDDLIAHLLLMRADEWKFWKQCEQHPIHELESGL